MSELPKKIMRIHEVSIRGETISIFLLRGSEVGAVERDEDFRRNFPASTFWAPERKRDFYLGRMAARRSIREITGKDPGWLPPSADGRPALPNGIAASLSHTSIDGRPVAVVAVAAASALRVGVDIEGIVTAHRFAKLAPRFEPVRALLRAKPPVVQLEPASLTSLFSAYEAAVKAIAQHGLGKVKPADFRDFEWNQAPPGDVAETHWRVVHGSSRRSVEGRIFAFGRAKIALGIG